MLNAALERDARVLQANIAGRLIARFLNSGGGICGAITHARRLGTSQVGSARVRGSSGISGFRSHLFGLALFPKQKPKSFFYRLEGSR
jgi:hypothetical protein